MSRIFMFGLIISLFPTSVRAQVAEADDLETIVAPSSSRQAVSADTAQAAQRIIEQTNRFRQEHDLQGVESDPELTEAAQYFADYMARTGKYGHTADGQRPSERAKEHGYEYCIVLENIAYQYSSRGFQTGALTSRFAEGWKKSPGHRKNMLDADVTQTGVAVAHSDESGVYYAVQMFGRPESQRVEFQVVNRSGEEVEYQIGERTIPLPPRVTVTHQRCRPTKLVFQWGDEASPQTQTVQAPSNSNLVVERDASGGLTVRRQQ